MDIMRIQRNHTKVQEEGLVREREWLIKTYAENLIRRYGIVDGRGSVRFVVSRMFAAFEATFESGWECHAAPEQRRLLL